MSYHTVRQGEWIAKIARMHGIHDAQKILNDPKNAGLKRKRPNPNILYPGDKVWIPEPSSKTIEGETEKRHKFVRHGPPPDMLTLFVIPGTYALKDVTNTPKEPIKFKLTLTLGSQVIEVIEGETDSDGRIHVQLPPGAERGQLELLGKTFTVLVGHLDPPEETTGVQARLNLLGYMAGPVDGIKGPRTEAAIKAFQAAQGLGVDGIVGPQTCERLAQIYGC